MKMSLMAGAVISVTMGAVAGAMAAMAMDKPEVRHMLCKGRKMVRRYMRSM